MLHRDDQKSEASDRQKNVLDSDNWPVPSWYSAQTGKAEIKSYEAYFAHQLRVRYSELEGDFRTMIVNPTYSAMDEITAERVVALLHIARNSLEEPKPNLLTVSSTLDLADRYMAGFIPEHFFAARSLNLRSQLRALHTEGGEELIEGIEKYSLKGADERVLRAMFDEATGYINRHIIKEQISSGLQIERLKKLRLWGVLSLLALFMIAPLAINPSSLASWPQTTLFDLKYADPLLGVLAIAAIGAIGGFLSGLREARASRVTLIQYQENMLKLQLRPLVGATVSVVLCVLLSWQILGITVVNFGSYCLIAFLSGFSERYFLKLVNVDVENQKDSSTGQTESEMEEGAKSDGFG